MKNVFPASSEPARTLRLVDADEREIEKLKAYERRSLATLALVTVLVAALFIGRVDERRVAALVAFLLAVAGLLPYLAVRLRRRALERRRDRVLNSCYDACKQSPRPVLVKVPASSSLKPPAAPTAPLSSEVESRTTPRARETTPVSPTSEPTLWLWRKLPAKS